VTPRSRIRPLPVSRNAAATASVPPANCRVCNPSTSSSVEGESTTAAFNRAVSPAIVIHEDGIAASSLASDIARPLRTTRCTRRPAATESIDLVCTITSRAGCPDRTDARLACPAPAACCPACMATRSAACRTACRCAVCCCCCCSAVGGAAAWPVGTWAPTPDRFDTAHATPGLGIAITVTATTSSSRRTTPALTPQHSRSPATASDAATRHLIPDRATAARWAPAGPSAHLLGKKDAQRNERFTARPSRTGTASTQRSLVGTGRRGPGRARSPPITTTPHLVDRRGCGRSSGSIGRRWPRLAVKRGHGRSSHRGSAATPSPAAGSARYCSD
jgi:hypothetical protein